MGCTLLLLKPVTIVSFSPSSSIVHNIEQVSITVDFSQKMKKDNTTNAFSLQEDSTPIYGSTSWITNTKLIFTPYRKLKKYKRYTITVETGAEDIYGNSLQKVFTHVFSSSTDTSKITVINTTPTHEKKISNPFEPFIVTFSEPVKKESVLEGFSIAPSVRGIKSFDNDTTLRFTPTDAYLYNQVYIVTLLSTISDLNGNMLSLDKKFHFSLDFDTTPPKLKTVKNYIQKTKTPPTTGSYTLTPTPIGALHPINNEWDTRWGFHFTFNKKMNVSTFLSALSITPSIAYKIRNNNIKYQSDIILLLNSDFIYDTRYYIYIDNSLQDQFGLPIPSPVQYIIHANAKTSKPPHITNIVYSKSRVTETSTTASLTPLSYLEAIDVSNFATKGYSFFDIYIDVAEGATMYSTNILEKLSIVSSNNTILISIVHADIISAASTTSDYITNVPPSPLPTSTQRIARILVEITNKSGQAIITFTLDDSLRDSLQNKIQSSWIWKVQK